MVTENQFAKAYAVGLKAFNDAYRDSLLSSGIEPLPAYNFNPKVLMLETYIFLTEYSNSLSDELRQDVCRVRDELWTLFKEVDK